MRLNSVFTRAGAVIGGLCLPVLLSACVSNDVLESAVAPDNSLSVSQTVQPQDLQTQDLQTQVAQSTLPTQSPQSGQEQVASLAPTQDTPSVTETAISTSANRIPDDPILSGETDELVGEVPANRTRKTYLVNGLLSAVPFIGFGFANLKKKMPEANFYSYISPVESVGVIMPTIIKDAEAAHRKDPNVAINLIGISIGADLVTVIANKLDEKNIPVNYLGIVDGTSLQPIPDNVRKADNLTCSYLDCTRARAKLAKGNEITRFERKVYKSSHIPLGNHEELHKRVIAQSNS